MPSGRRERSFCLQWLWDLIVPGFVSVRDYELEDLHVDSGSSIPKQAIQTSWNKWADYGRRAAKGSVRRRDRLLPTWGFPWGKDMGHEPVRL